MIDGEKDGFHGAIYNLSSGWRAATRRASSIARNRASADSERIIQQAVSRSPYSAKATAAIIRSNVFTKDPKLDMAISSCLGSGVFCTENAHGHTQLPCHFV
jgi:hypothetical protein